MTIPIPPRGAAIPAVRFAHGQVEEARSLLLDSAREMIVSARDEGREPPIGGGHVEAITIDLAACSGTTSKRASAP